MCEHLQGFSILPANAAKTLADKPPVAPDTCKYRELKDPVVAVFRLAIIDRMVIASPTASIIVPTYREAANIQTLTERIFAALRQAGIEAELILVDDNSQDGTEEIVADLATRFPVRVIVRTQERGLSSAVLKGLAEARADRLVVLDADLQHPPELIPEFIRKLDDDGCDFVLGTRYGCEGGIDASWPLARRLVSKVATLLARPLAPLSDPMSGFFAIRRQAWQRAAHLNPIGYKIALELFVKSRCERAAEVPIRFAARTAGESKLSAAEQWRYLRHLLRLYRFRFPLMTWAVMAMAAVGCVGLTYAALR